MNNDLFSKLQEARQKIEEAKIRLNSIIVEVEARGGGLKVRANANKTIVGFEFTDEFLNSHSRVEVEDVLLATTNRALEQAAQRGETEMKNITQGLLPDFPGLV
ncbi:MAG: YbaB/EbfC family nucleoid-associated protein [Bacteroidales bacterium]